MKSTQRKVSGAPIPTRMDTFVFSLKAFALRAKRRARNLFTPLARSKPHAGFPDGVLLADSVSRLRYADEDTARTLVDGKIHNLRRAIRTLDGIVIRRGQIFSFWRHVGKLTRGRGYVAGRELREGCIIPRIGGGICQLSNAIYDAALKAGLEIVERHGHTAVIKGSLAESGRDATVFWNYVDLRLRGECDWQLRAKMDGEHLTVSIFGNVAETEDNPAAKNDDAPKTCTPTPLGDCSWCGRTDCHLCVTGKLRDEERTTWLCLDEDWPEFSKWRKENLSPGDRVLAAGGSFRGKCVEFLSKVWRRYHLWLGKREIERGEKLSRRDGRYLYSWRKYPIPVALNARFEMVARHLAGRLRFSDTHLVIPQPLLVPLYRAGELAGRTYDVLMSALPIPEIERRLDKAMERYGFRVDGTTYEATDPANPCGENGVTLGDFRASAESIEAEREALKGASRLISPHKRILDWAGPRGVALDRLMPEAKVPATSAAETGRRFSIFLAGVTLGRKGIFDLRAALREVDFDYELLLVPSAVESRDFWGDIPVRMVGSIEEGVALGDVVVLPAVVEHNPRGILLAIASGKAAIASDACGLPENGKWLRADDAGELKQRLAEVFAYFANHQPSHTAARPSTKLPAV